MVRTRATTYSLALQQSSVESAQCFFLRIPLDFGKSLQSAKHPSPAFLNMVRSYSVGSTLVDCDPYLKIWHTKASSQLRNLRFRTLFGNLVLWYNRMLGGKIRAKNVYCGYPTIRWQGTHDVGAGDRALVGLIHWAVTSLLGLWIRWSPWREVQRVQGWIRPRIKHRKKSTFPNRRHIKKRVTTAKK